jgi:signal transduction histidine kinase
MAPCDSNSVQGIERRLLGHELRTPLTIMRGYLSLAITGEVTCADHLDKLVAATNQLHDVVERLLAEGSESEED